MTQTMKEPVHVVAICGSLRLNSYTALMLKIALRGAAEVGAETKLIQLKEYQLAFCDGNKDERHYPPDVARLRQEIQQAQGIILGTPEYHGSYSGVLKNALDLTGFKEFEGKMLGLVGVSGGGMGALNALNGLRTVGRALHAWVIPEQVGLSTAWKQFDQTGQIQDKELEGRLLDLGRQVARFAYLHTSKQSLEFLKLWESAPPNPGGD